MKLSKIVLSLTIFLLTFLVIFLFYLIGFPYTPYFILFPSSIIIILLLFAFAFFIITVYKSEEERKMKNLYNLPLPFIEKIEELYEALKKEKLGKVSRIIDEIYRQYKEEIYELPSHLQEVFVDIVNSSRHPHYNEKRKKNDLRRLKEVLEELRKYRQRTSSSIYLK